MTSRKKGRVERIVAAREGVQELAVRVCAEQDVPVGQLSEEPAARPALNLTALTGALCVGDEVEINTAAVDLGLGTGGYDLVISLLNRAQPAEEFPGHIIKLRYTPMQTPVLSLEAPESTAHQEVAEFTTLNEAPVVCFELHSQLPAICAALRWGLGECGKSARVAYIMTDGAALPMAISRLVPQLLETGLIDHTITAGQAFGGEYEAVNLYSAMAAARCALNADVIVVGQGPGNVGTGTPLGFSGIDQGLAINAAASLGGSPVFVPRISFGDKRERHVGLSHHTFTNLTKVVRARALLPIPRLPRARLKQLYATLAENGILKQHDVFTVDAEKGLTALEQTGIAVTTMGRSLDQERAFFLAAAAAGLLAAQIIEHRK